MKIKMPKLPKIDGKTVKGFVDWLHEKDCGCCHFHLTDSEDYRIHICIGWHEFDDAEPGPNMTFIHKPVWKVAWKIGMETFNNAMQADLDIDFIMPYDEKTGDVCDTLSEIGEITTMKGWNALAAEMNRTAKEAVKWQFECEQSREED
jgi:hypothetical protein